MKIGPMTVGLTAALEKRVEEAERALDERGMLADEISLTSKPIANFDKLLSKSWLCFRLVKALNLATEAEDERKILVTLARILGYIHPEVVQQTNVQTNVLFEELGTTPLTTTTEPDGDK